MALVFLSLVALTACNVSLPFSREDAPVVEEASKDMEGLYGRSFRQFDPSRDADKRKAIVLDFSETPSVWAQYSRDGVAVHEWEITAASIPWFVARVTRGKEVYYHMVVRYPTVTKTIAPTEEPLVLKEFNIYIRNVDDPDSIEFRLGQHIDLPTPFPVFRDWTRFIEDEKIE